MVIRTIEINYFRILIKCTKLITSKKFTSLVAIKNKVKIDSDGVRVNLEHKTNICLN